MSNKVSAYVFYSIPDFEKVEKHKSNIINFAKKELNIDSNEIDFYVDICPRKERKEIHKLLDNIEKNQYTILLIDHMSHLLKIRNEEEMMQLVELTKKINNNGVKIYSIMDNKVLV